MEYRGSQHVVDQGMTSAPMVAPMANFAPQVPPGMMMMPGPGCFTMNGMMFVPAETMAWPGQEAWLPEMQLPQPPPPPSQAPRLAYHKAEGRQRTNKKIPPRARARSNGATQREAAAREYAKSLQWPDLLPPA